MAEMGFKSYRFSINWTRIFPKGVENKPNLKGIEFYNNLINELIKYNIEPLVTIHHFDQPLHLEELGGWANRMMIDAYLKYSKTLFENFGDRVKYWQTINEQNMMILFGHLFSIKAEKDEGTKIY